MPPKWYEWGAGVLCTLAPKTDRLVPSLDLFTILSRFFTSVLFMVIITMSRRQQVFNEC